MTVGGNGAGGTMYFDLGAQGMRWRNNAFANILSVNVNDQIGIGTISQTAVLHIKAGTALAGTGPLKLTSGTNMVVAENAET